MFKYLRPYHDIRPAQLPWVETVPSHWRIERAKSVMRSVDVRSDSGSEELLTVSSSRGVVPRSSATVTMFQAQSYVGHKLCWPDDLVINSLWAWGRGLGVAQHHGIVSTAYGVYRNRPGAQLQPTYLHYLVRSEPFQWELQARSQGVWKSRLQMTDARWLDAPLLLPPVEEQAAIVKYLAHANARIDKAIGAKRRLIALLEEQSRTQMRALISGSTDDELVRKDSGLSWLEKVPSHWEVRKLRSLFRYQGSGTTPSGENYYGGQHPWLMSGDLNDSVINKTARTVTSEAFEEFSSLREHSAGSLVIAMYGASIGKTGLLGVNASTNQACAVLSDPRSGIEPRYVQSVMRVARPALQELGSGGGQPNVNGEKIAQFKIPVPPHAEQVAIAQALMIEGTALAGRVKVVRRKIDLMNEFRARLVADAVTGKVNVREIAASLPNVDMEQSWGTSYPSVDDHPADFDDVIEVSED